MTPYERTLAALEADPQRWLVTGGAGFLGSHVVEALLRRGQHVTVLDDLSTGRLDRLEAVRRAVGTAAAGGLAFTPGDVRDAGACAAAASGTAVVLHLAGIASAARALAQPLAAQGVNATGLLNVLLAARVPGVRRVVFAGPSAPASAPSPLAASRRSGELWAAAFAAAYGADVVGLRLSPLYGPRQGPAWLVPRLASALLRGEPVLLPCDGQRAVDPCHVSDAVQAVLLAATTATPEARGEVLDVGGGEPTTLLHLFELVREAAARYRPGAAGAPATPGPPPAGGDELPAVADGSRARALLGYAPAVGLAEGIAGAVDWEAAALHGGEAQAAAPA